MVKAVIQVIRVTANLGVTFAKLILPWGSFPDGKVIFEADGKPLTNVKVQCLNFGLWSECTTDNNGKFNMWWAKFIIGTVFWVGFDTDKCQIKQWDSRDWWTITKSVLKFPFSEKYSHGWTNIGQMNNMTISVHGDQESFWCWLLRGVDEYHRLASNNRLLTYDEKMMIYANYSKDGGASSAPLTKNVAKDILYPYNVFFGLAGVTYALAMAADLLHAPDLIISKKEGNISEMSVNNTLFHELGHTSHYRKIGAISYRKLWSEIFAKNGYGEKNGTNAGYICLGESWANFVQHTFMNQKYGDHPDYRYRDENDPEYRSDRKKSKHDSWITYGLFHDLIDNQIDALNLDYEPITDYVNRFTVKQLYDGLSPGQDTPQKYRDKLFEMYGYEQECAIRQLFYSYGYGDDSDGFNIDNAKKIHILNWKPFPLRDKFIDSFTQRDECGNETVFENDGEIDYHINDPANHDIITCKYTATNGSIIEIPTKTLYTQDAEGYSYRILDITYRRCISKEVKWLNIVIKPKVEKVYSISSVGLRENSYFVIP